MAMMLSFSLLSLFYRIQNRSYHRSSIFAFCSLFLFYLFGVMAMSEQQGSKQRDHYLNIAPLHNNQSLLLLQISKPLRSTKYSDRYVVELLQVDHSKANGSLLLSIAKAPDVISLRIGEQLVVKKALSKIRLPRNPHQFNYKEYAELRGIYRQINLSKNEFIICENQAITLNSLAQNFRIRVTSSLEKAGFSTTEVNMIKALLLGQRDGISEELIKNYSRAGAIHILAISGLHVGIVLAILNFVLKPLNRFKKTRSIKLLLSLFVLWCFALIAGLSPSVVRAVTMFSAVALGLFGKRSNSLNHNLVISIFLLLLLRPRYLFEIGFQLSYLAVFAIVSIQPIFYKLWNPSWALTRYFWQLLTVSLAAQIGVLPLSLYYFHQFPGLFFFSNLFVIPLLGCLLCFGVVIIVLALLNSMPPLIMASFGKLIELLNSFIKWVAHQEAFLFENIPFTAKQAMVSYVFFVLFIYWIYQKSFRRLQLVLLSLLLFQKVFFYELWYTNSQNHWIVFNSWKTSLVAKKEGRKLIVYQSSEKPSYPKAVLDAYIAGANTVAPIMIKGLPRNELFKQQILLVDNSGLYPSKSTRGASVLLVQSPKINIDRLIEIVKPDQIIADHSNYRSYVHRWKHSCKRYQIPFHYTDEDGAWISTD